jgi:hypothetical protein
MQALPAKKAKACFRGRPRVSIVRAPVPTHFVLEAIQQSSSTIAPLMFSFGMPTQRVESHKSGAASRGFKPIRLSTAAIDPAQEFCENDRSSVCLKRHSLVLLSSRVQMRSNSRDL